MKKKILLGSITAVTLLILVSIAPSINANVSKSSLEPIADVDVIEENATPIVLVLQLITKLRNHKDIQSVETTFDDFITIKTYIIGKFNTIAFEFKFGRKHVYLTCDKGDILLFGLGLKWNEEFGWIPTRFTYRDATIVDLPRFGGIIFLHHIIGSSHGEVTWIG